MRFVQNAQSAAPLVTPSGEIIHELVGKAAGESPNHSLAYIRIPPGKSSNAHYHQVSQETYYILEGQGQMRVNEAEFVIRPGQMCHIDAQEIHQISNQGERDLVFLAVCVPPWVPADSFEV